MIAWSQIFFGLGLFLLVNVFVQPKSFSTEWWYLFVGDICLSIAVGLILSMKDKKDEREDSGS